MTTMAPSLSSVLDSANNPSDVLDVLQFALLLEYLEADFYQRGMAASNLIPTADRVVFGTIAEHEAVHVTTLQAVIRSKGAMPIAKPTFDYSAKGALQGFAFASGQYETFKALAMAFEDTGVRAYKGQAARLISDKAVLSAALSIHSVEARHAAQVRRLRGKKGWIVGNSREDLPAFTQGIYDGEELASQGGVALSSLPGFSANGGTMAATEAFDEPLTKEQVTAIVMPFLT
jgi:rubrerythrin